MRKKLAIAFPFILLPLQILAQETLQYDNLTTKLEAYVNNLAPEKTYLHMDKDLYIHGDTIWFKAYVLNGMSHSKSNQSKVVYVELLNSRDSVIVKRKLYIDGSSAFGDIKVDDTVEEGVYFLRAYTRYMLNNREMAQYQKKISILALPLPKNILTNDTISKNTNEQSKIKVPHQQGKKLNVQFFPEGGNLIADLQNGLGLKITDEGGNGIALKGTIIDQYGIVVARFETQDFGLGIIPFTPKTDNEYYAEIHSNGNRYKYHLPTALDQGYVVQLKNMGAQIMIQVSTNISEGLKGTLLLGHVRGKAFLKHSIGNGNKKSYILKIPTTELSDGVAHFILFDGEGESICERSTFIANPENEMDLILKTDKADYGLREKVELELSISDNQGKPVQGDFSISVSSDKVLLRNTPHIKSWLLLNSDIGNTVENPNYFFNGDSHKRQNPIDILMLAQSWKSLPIDSLKIRPEKGILINGRTTSFNNKNRPIRTLVTLNILGQDLYQEKQLTDAQGKFSFGPLVLIDSVQAIITASSPEQDKKNPSKIAIHIDPPPLGTNIDPIRPVALKKNALPQHEIMPEYRNIANDFRYAPDVIPLSEVVVQAKKKTKQERIEEELNKLTIHGTAQNRLFPDSVPGIMASATVFDLLRRVAGVQVLGTFPNQSVLIRGINSFSGSTNPLFTIDGVPVSSDFIQSMTVKEMLFVDVLKGNEAAIYGARGANGVVAIYTDRGIRFEEPPIERPGIADLVVQGFYRANEFYAPNYSVDKLQHRRPDHRTTLYWNPALENTGKVPTKLSFYSGDVTGKYTATVEGITHDGRPVHKQFSFFVLD